MGRIVRSAVVSKGSLEADDEGGQNGQGETDSKDGDGYLDRVAKYVPAEIVAFFIFVNSILANAVEKPVAKAMAAASNDEAISGKVREAIDLEKMAGISVWTISWAVLFVAHGDDQPGAAVGRIDRDRLAEQRGRLRAPQARPPTGR